MSEDKIIETLSAAVEKSWKEKGDEWDTDSLDYLKKARAAAKRNDYRFALSCVEGAARQVWGRGSDQYQECHKKWPAYFDEKLDASWAA